MAEPLDVIQLTQELVRIPSESSLPTATDPLAVEDRVVQCLRRYCQQAGLSVTLQEALPGRHNLLLRLPRPGAPRLVFVAHMDTVSGAGMDTPFAAEILDGKIWGRGACDDKGPLACVFSTLVNSRLAATPLAYDITFVGTVDEECTMSGASRLAEELDGWDLCIALEPTRLQVINAHKGVYRFYVHTEGLAAHSSTPELGDNALHAMLDIISDLQEYGKQLSLEHDPDLGQPCLSLTQIASGSSLNIIPAQCRLGVDIRILPDTDPLRVGQTIQQLVGKRGRVEEVYQGSGIRADSSQPLVQDFLAAHHAEGMPGKLGAVPFATDCAKLAHRGPCIVWGPGDIAQAHKQNEYIDTEQLKTAVRILTRFIHTTATKEQYGPDNG